MNVLTSSRFLIILFVGSVTLWYCITPYIISPHPGIVNDVLTKTKLASQGPVQGQSANLVSIENWTKWRIYVNDTDNIVYGNSWAQLPLGENSVMHMEWRSDYEIHVSRLGEDRTTDVKRVAPAAGEYGIYNHFVATAADGGDGAKAPSSVVRVVPRFLFGIPFDTIEDMYGDDVSKFPVIGVFSDSPRFDRIIIQAYMNVVTLSVIFLLYANNPPHLVVKTKTK